MTNNTMTAANNGYNSLVEWLESYWKKKHIVTYRGLESSPEFKEDIEAAKKSGTTFFIDPLLPTDLVAVERKTPVKVEEGEKKEEEFYYSLFWIMHSPDPNLETRLQFYQFYLTRISELNRIKMIIVIPARCKYDLKTNIETIAKNNGFGLWEIDNSKHEPSEIFLPKTFRDRMVDELKDPPDSRNERFGEEILKEAENLSLFFDKYIRDAVEAMVGITPEQLAKRNIERKILDLVFELKHISYGNKLRELVTDYLEKKGNDYDFVATAFSELWHVCDLKTVYSDFLKIYEKALYHICAGEKQVYRDHYLHQFQVFLLGLHIIDNFQSHFERLNIQLNILEKQWLVAASFHDMAYPVQLYDGWAKEFFKKIFGISNLGASDLRSGFIDQSLLSSMGYLINSLCETHLKRRLSANWLAKERDLVLFFYDKITNAKPHCILSGISLLQGAKKGTSNNSGKSKKLVLLEKIMVPAALAITLHDKAIWGDLRKKHALDMISFDNDPLTFLLLFCDCVQEWGRPSPKLEERKPEERFLLKSIKPEKDGYSVTIYTPALLTTDEFFDKTEQDIKTLEKFLRQPSAIKFTIIVEDKTGAQRAYEMKGKQGI